MVILVRDLHEEEVLSPMVVTIYPLMVAGITKEVASPLQSTVVQNKSAFFSISKYEALAIEVRKNVIMDIYDSILPDHIVSPCSKDECAVF